MVSSSIFPFGSVLTLCLCIAQMSFAVAFRDPSYQSVSPAVPGEFRHLFPDMMGKAVSHLSPMWRNPEVSEWGLDPQITAVLQQQQSYLQSSPPSSVRARLAVPPFSAGRSPTCHSPAVLSVNGRSAGVIFTPLGPNNIYRIEGCFFGSRRGHLELQPSTTSPATRSSPLNLIVDDGPYSWTDTEIDAHLDPKIAGVPDTPVTLVIYSQKGQRLKLPGCFFVARRGDPQLLDAIPASWIHLQPSSVRSRAIDQLEFVSPPVRGAAVPSDAAGTSAFVSRYDSENFGAGADVFDFSQLNPGWVVHSVQLQTYQVTCPDSPNLHSTGRWGTGWNGRKLTVNLQDDTCRSRVSPSFVFNLSASQYALKVWVIGPVGTKPLADALLHDRNRSLTN